MSRRKTSKSGGGKFKRLLGWTVLMAIVFSAGLITGERLVRRQALAPLVSVTDQVAKPAKDGKTAKDDEAKEEEEPTFAFFDQLTRKDEVALSSTRKEADKPEAKAKPEPKPEPNKAKEEPAEKKQIEDEQADEQPAEKAPSARYTLQVAAHPDMSAAKSHMERLRKMGLEPHVITAEIPGKGKFYRVRVGKFGTMEEARSFQSNLKRKNSLNTFVSPL